MKNLFKKPLSGKSLIFWVIGLFYLKFLIFDLIWAAGTTFSGFQFPTGWLTKLAFASLLALPLIWIRRRWYVACMGLAVDMWLISNLLYYRTYYTIIPLSSYALVGNLADFTDSVWDSFRLVDILFPLTTAIVSARIWSTKIKDAIKAAYRSLCRIMAALIVVPLVIVVGYVQIVKGGYRAAYEDLMYDYSTCGAAVYTIPGVWLYQAIAYNEELTPEVVDKIEAWLDEKPDSGELPFSIAARDNMILILCESLESWVINQEVEGNEITPNLNRLIAESNTFYAPYIYNQVGGARSIDAQLIIHTGLLPVGSGAYSSRFPHHTYYSIDKALKEKYPGNSTSMSFTVDKKTVWNAHIAAFDFGYDKLVDKPNFVLDVKTGPRHRLGDDSFLRQSYEKLADSDEYWIPGGHNLVQLVTYSGHTPFVIPDELKKIHFSDKIPERLRNYMQVANYTDSAIGQFVEKIRSNPRFDDTMIVITGDHEGIGIDRREFVKDPEVAKWLSAGQYVPLIVFNSPVEGRYDQVMGQIDIYPTLMDLMGLDSYAWKGLGASALRPGKQPFAVTWQNEVVTFSDSIPQEAVDHARRAYEVSDLIISCDYFNDELRENLEK